MIKPYKFFRPSEVLNKPRVAMVAGMQGGLYAAANTWWSTAWYAKTEKGKYELVNPEQIATVKLFGQFMQLDIKTGQEVLQAAYNAGHTLYVKKAE